MCVILFPLVSCLLNVGRAAVLQTPTMHDHLTFWTRMPFVGARVDAHPTTQLPHAPGASQVVTLGFVAPLIGLRAMLHPNEVAASGPSINNP